MDQTERDASVGFTEAELTEPRVRPRWNKIGPGIVAAATGVGAADLVATLTAGSRYGYMLLWAVVVGVLMKILLVEGVGRYYLSTGKTIFQGWRTLGVWTSWYFGIYIIIWGFVYGATAMSSVALPLAALFPGVDSKIFAIASGLIDAGVVVDLNLTAAKLLDVAREAVRGRPLIGVLRDALSDIEAINAVFDTKLPGAGPELDPLVRLLRRAVARLASEAGEPEPAAEAETSPDAPAESRAAPAASGEITSQRDVEQALDRIISYYAKYEPSSPLPILLARAKKLVGADFMTIVQEIAPAGADNVKLIGGLE